MKNSFNILLLFILLTACRDNNVIDTPVQLELNPPPNDSPIFVTDAFSPSGKKSLAWSIDLNDWEYWNNGFGLGNSVIDRNTYIIYTKNTESETSAVFYTEDGFRNSVEYKNAPVARFDDAISVNNILVLVEGGFNLYFTKDFGDNWTKKEFELQFYEIEYVNGYFLIFGQNGMQLKSSDCEVWDVNEDIPYFPAYYNKNGKVYYPGNQYLFISEIGSFDFIDSISVTRNLNSGIETMVNCHFIVNEDGIAALGTFRDPEGTNAYLAEFDFAGNNWELKQTFLPESGINNFPNLPWDYPGINKSGEFYLIELYSYSFQAFTSYYSIDGQNWERVNNDIINIKNKSVYYIDSELNP